MLRLSTISLSAYVIPAALAIALAPQYGYDFSETGLEAIFASIAASVFGYLVSFPYRRKIAFAAATRKNRTDTFFSLMLMAIGASAMVLNFSLQGRLPLLSSGQGRIELQQTFLWNIYILGMLGLLLYSRATIGRRHSIRGGALVATYILFALLTAWKGTLILALVSYVAPRIRGISFKIIPLVIGAAALFFLFLAVNVFRSGISFEEGMNQPIFYLIWGFVNFDAEAVGHSSACLHTIPIFGCQFSVDNSDLISSTWNVFSALSPIYLDGGVPYVVVFFMVSGFALGYFERARITVMSDYLFFLFNYFFLLAHNGYAFYSKTFFVSLGGLVLIGILKGVSHAMSRRVESS